MWRAIITLVAFCSAPLLGAEETKNPSGENPESIRLRGFAFSHFEGIAQLELRHEENTIGTLDLPTGQLRNPIMVSARTFSYGVTTDGVFRPLGKTELPPDGKDFILVVTPDKNGYKAFPIRTDDPDFQGNDAFVFNFTKSRLEIVIGEAKHHVEPLENANLRPKYPENATFYQAMFSYEKDDSFVPFNNSRWPVNNNTRSLVFVSIDEKTKTPIFRSVTEAVGK